MKNHLSLLLGILSLWIVPFSGYAQESPEEDLPLKLDHVEPLYRDLIRDLGARKGEQEWNVRSGFTNEVEYHSYELSLEYEWVVSDRFGLEVEVPFSFYGKPSNPGNSVPENRIEGISLGGQYTFLISEEMQTSMAVGNRLELQFTDLDELSFDHLTQGILFNPYFVAAKRFSDSWHGLIYTGPRYLIGWNEEDNNFAYEVNTSIHYKWSDSDNFVGLEINQTIEDGELKTILRPQVNLDISDSINFGLIPGFSLNPDEERFSSFIRLVYEPD